MLKESLKIDIVGEYSLSPWLAKSSTRSMRDRRVQLGQEESGLGAAMLCNDISRHWETVNK
jgi:hypothetical protein